MKRLLLALSAFAALLAGTMASANALEVHVGTGGVYVAPHHRYYDYYGNCRVVITHRVNRWGEDVTVRRRICD